MVKTKSLKRLYNKNTYEIVKLIKYFNSWSKYKKIEKELRIFTLYTQSWRINSLLEEK
jgi:hypothetical protein